jgi:hypothetical protein
VNPNGDGREASMTGLQRQRSWSNWERRFSWGSPGLASSACRNSALAKAGQPVRMLSGAIPGGLLPADL